MRSTAYGLLALLIVGYLGLFVETHLECRGVTLPINGGLTAVFIFGLGAGLVAFVFAYLQKPRSGQRFRFSRFWSTSVWTTTYRRHSWER